MTDWFYKLVVEGQPNRNWCPCCGSEVKEEERFHHVDKEGYLITESVHDNGYNPNRDFICSCCGVWTTSEWWDRTSACSMIDRPFTEKELEKGVV